jgi:hypothetical protein
MNPYAKAFVPSPLNPEEYDIQPHNPFKRAVAVANPEKKADEELEAFLAWANSQKAQKAQTANKAGTRGGARRTRKGTGCVSRKKTRSKNKRS